MSAANDNPDAAPKPPVGGGSAKLFALIAGAVVVAAVLAGLAVSDAPWTAREQKLDQSITRNLGVIQRSIEAHTKLAGVLPTRLADLVGPPKNAQSGSIAISASCLPGIEYEVPDAKGTDYTLCATFLRDSSGDDQSYSEAWKHKKGRTCFALKVP